MLDQLPRFEKNFYVEHPNVVSVQVKQCFTPLIRRYVIETSFSLQTIEIDEKGMGGSEQFPREEGNHCEWSGLSKAH